MELQLSFQLPMPELMSIFQILGMIISHAYLVAGFLPERLAFPCLAASLLGPESSFDSDILEHEVVSCLSAHEAGVLRDAIKYKGTSYPSEILSEVIAILGSYGCRCHPIHKI